MIMYFSPSKLGWFPDFMKDRYGSAWPEDAVEVSNEVYNSFQVPQPKGKKLGTVDGQPAWVDYVPPVLDAAAAAKKLDSNVQVALNEGALSWGYTNGIDAALSWGTSAVVKYRTEGNLLSKWRDAVYQWVEQQPAGTTSIDGMPAMPTRPGTSVTPEGTNSGTEEEA